MTARDAEQSLEQELRELRSVNELIRTLTSTLELHEILRIVLERLKVLTQADALSLLLYDPERDELVFAATETLRENAAVGLRVPSSRSLAGQVVRTGESAIVDDVSNERNFFGEFDHITRFRTRSLLSVPLRRDGRVVGVLEALNRSGGRGFSQEDRERLERLAAEAGDAREPEELCRDPVAMRALLLRATATVPCEAISLLLLDSAGHELVFRASREFQSGIIEGLRMPCDRGIAGWVARHRQPVRVDEVTRDPRYFSGLEQQTRLVPRTMICVPMMSKETLRGVIQVINKADGSTFTESELALAQTLADHAAIAIENASLYRKAYEASITDDLTGLGNTRHFNHRLPQLLARGGPVSLVMLDLDNFKAVVDGYGHLVGSRTIAQIGRMISRFLRSGDVAARFGGDEFVIALPDTDSPAAVAIAESIRAAIEECSELEGERVDLSGVTASLGVATFPAQAANAQSLFHAADDAMYAGKRLGKNRVILAAKE